MKTKPCARRNFNDSERAEIFVRDRATCGFSGISLWLPDYGIRPNWQMDWVDHIRPASKGGSTSTKNAICATHTFNSKKRGNGADNVFFIKDGQVTSHYVWTFGSPTSELSDQLVRLANLQDSDWYLNRCIANTFLGFNWRCDSQLYGIEAKRDDGYWFGSGWKRLESHSRLRTKTTVRDRGLITTPEPFGTDLLLELEGIETQNDYLLWTKRIFPIYQINWLTFCKFLDAGDDLRKQTEIRKKASDNPKIHPEILKIIERPAFILDPNK